MEVFHSRLESFHKTKRVKLPHGKPSAISVKWPHPDTFLANPTSLAEAGFYFAPTWNDRDSVTCFLCKKQLSDWSQEDDPFILHWTECRDNCAWAVVRCGLTEDLDKEGQFVFKESTRLPTSRAMEEARLTSFGSWWPHDSVKNHGATSKKIAAAGFVYTPQEPGDDTATCLYCNVSLSGWDDDDDPVQEHHKRVKKSGRPCAFFTPMRPPPPTKTRKSRAVSRSKKPAPSEPNTSPEPVLEEPTPVAKTTSKARRQRSRKPPTRRAPTDEDESVPEDAPRTPSPPQKATTSKSARALQPRSAPSAVDGTSASEGDFPRDNATPVPKTTSKPSRSRAKKSAVRRVATHGDESKRGRTPKASSRAKKTKVVYSDEESDLPVVPRGMAPHYANDANDERWADEVPGSGSPDELAIMGEQPTPIALPRPKKTPAKMGTVRKHAEPAVPVDRAWSIDLAQPDHSQPSSATTSNPFPQVLQAKLTPQPEKRIELDTTHVASKSAALQTVYRSPATRDEESPEDQFSGDTAAPKLDSSSKLHPSKSIAAQDILGPVALKEQSTLVVETEDSQVAPQETGKPVSDNEEGKSHLPVDTLSLPQLEDATHATGITTGIFPALAHQPIENITACSDELLDMTVEEWIRHEIKLQYEQFKMDGQKVLESFYERAAEMRKMIEAL